MSENNKALERSQEKKKKIGKYLSLLVILQYIIFTVLILQHSSMALPLCMGIEALVFTAATIFFYFKDLIAGVLRTSEEEELEYEKMVEEKAEKIISKRKNKNS